MWNAETWKIFKKLKCLIDSARNEINDALRSMTIVNSK